MTATLKKDPQQVAAAAAIKAQRERDGAQAMREYRAQELALRANTARLRALRLARNAENTEPAKRPNASNGIVRSTQQPPARKQRSYGAT